MVIIIVFWHEGQLTNQRLYVVSECQFLIPETGKCGMSLSSTRCICVLIKDVCACASTTRQRVPCKLEQLFYLLFSPMQHLLSSLRTPPALFMNKYWFNCLRCRVSNDIGAIACDGCVTSSPWTVNSSRIVDVVFWQLSWVVPQGP